MVTVTSALPRDGKTLTAVNLALTLSESYSRRVLLIDADLRRPVRAPGIGDSKSCRVERGAARRSSGTATRHYLSNAKRLDLGALSFDTTGRPASQRMGTLLDECASRFDWVLLDVPPVGLLADAQILGRLTGAVILVIRAGATPYAWSSELLLRLAANRSLARF